MIISRLFHGRVSVSVCDKEVSMAQRHEKTMTGRIFDNIIFLEEVFGDKPDTDIPDVPVLELAQCFELSQPRRLRPNKARRTSSQRGSKAGKLSSHQIE